MPEQHTLRVTLAVFKEEIKMKLTKFMCKISYLTETIL